MQLISKEAAIEELQSIANTIKGVGEWERYFEGLKLGYLSAAKTLDRLPIEENRTTAGYGNISGATGILSTENAVYVINR